MLDGLTDEHSIERIAMERRQFVKMKHGTLMKRERHYSMPFTMSHDELIERSGKRQLTERMFNRNFPHRYRTEQDLMGGVGKDLQGIGREVLSTRNNP